MSHGVDLQIFYGSSGHLDDEGALDLFPGLGALDERQAGVHSDFGAEKFRVTRSNVKTTR